ncbi:phage tail protein [Escherichia coli]|uniref:phage tail protein n=1 Tax=Escherichia coli TaxID=562 RepID=UPI001A7EF82F
MRTCHNSVRRGTFSVILLGDALYAGMERPDADVRSGQSVRCGVAYTSSDVVVDDNGVGFRYSFSALKDRHTAVEVNYTDPQNGWQTSTELVEDPEAILRYGRNLLKMDAFGCTSRGQAHRAGLWVIKTGLLETQTVDFTLGSQGCVTHPVTLLKSVITTMPGP